MDADDLPIATMRLEDARHLRQLATAIGVLKDEAKLTINRQGLHSKVLDAGHIAVGIIEILKPGFWALDVERENETAVDIDRMSAVADSFALGEECEIEFSPTPAEVTYTQGRIKRSAPLIGTSGFTDPKVPDLDLPGEALIPNVGELRGFIRTVEKQTAKAVTINVDPTKGLTVTGEGELAQDTYHVDASEADMPGDWRSESVESRFSTDYLSHILKACREIEKASPEASTRIYVGNDYPIRIVARNPILNATYHLAPKLGDK